MAMAIVFGLGCGDGLLAMESIVVIAARYVVAGLGFLVCATFKYRANGEWEGSIAGKPVGSTNPSTLKTPYKVQACKPVESAQAAQKVSARTPVWKGAEMLLRFAGILKDQKNATAEALVQISLGVVHCVVLKPPTQGPVSALHMVHCLHMAGFPKALVAAITGKGSSRVIQGLVEDSQAMKAKFHRVCFVIEGAIIHSLGSMTIPAAQSDEDFARFGAVKLKRANVKFLKVYPETTPRELVIEDYKAKAAFGRRETKLSKHASDVAGHGLTDGHIQDQQVTEVLKHELAGQNKGCQIVLQYTCIEDEGLPHTFHQYIHGLKNTFHQYIHGLKKGPLGVNCGASCLLMILLLLLTGSVTPDSMLQAFGVDHSVAPYGVDHPAEEAADEADYPMEDVAEEVIQLAEDDSRDAEEEGEGQGDAQEQDEEEDEEGQGDAQEQDEEEDEEGQGDAQEPDEEEDEEGQGDAQEQDEEEDEEGQGDAQEPDEEEDEEGQGDAEGDVQGDAEGDVQGDAHGGAQGAQDAQDGGGDIFARNNQRSFEKFLATFPPLN